MSQHSGAITDAHSPHELIDALQSIALVQVEGIEPGKLYEELWTKHRIITSPTKWAGVEGIRVTPNVYSTLDEIDRFTEVMGSVLRRST